MKKLNPYIISGKQGEYIAEIWKIEEGKYNYRILLEHELIDEKNEVIYKNREKLNKVLRKLIREYDKGEGLIFFINRLKKITRHHSQKLWDQIKERDGNRCQKCGRKSDPDIHHIISVDNYVDFLAKKLDKEKLKQSKEIMEYFTKHIINDPQNLITLCNKCHRKNMDNESMSLMIKSIKNMKGSSFELFIPKWKLRESLKQNSRLKKDIRFLKNVLESHDIKYYPIDLYEKINKK